MVEKSDVKSPDVLSLCYFDEVFTVSFRTPDTESLDVCFTEKGSFTEVLVCDLDSGTLHAAKRLRQTSIDQMFRCYEVECWFLITCIYTCNCTHEHMHKHLGPYAHGIEGYVWFTQSF